MSIYRGINIERGQIWTANLEEDREIHGCNVYGKSRPVIIIRPEKTKYTDCINIVPLTSNIRDLNDDYIKLYTISSGLSKECVIVPEQIKTISTSKLIKHVGNIDKTIMLKLEIQIAELFTPSIKDIILYLQGVDYNV